MQEPVDSIVDVRKAFMVASTEGDQKPILRTAHFLKPTLLNGNPPHSPPPPSPPLSSDPSKWPLKVDFKNWVYHSQDWSQWVDQMEAKYGHVWKKVGIFGAVKASATIRITKDSNLILDLAQKWSPETNTFVFPWGEATLTLEDVKVIGGYSVLGSPVSTPLETDEMTVIKQELEKARVDVARGKYKKPGISPWMKKFMGSGTKIEHEAFLACWLSGFVFNKNKIIKADVFKVAVNLARGTRIALAPAVLASIYKDLTVIKKYVFCFAQGMIEGGESVLPVWASFVLVQAWIWERFPSLSPKRTKVRLSEPRITLWRDNYRIPRVANMGSALDSEKFQWRPYTEPLMNSAQNDDSEKWVSIDVETCEELLSLAKFLIPSQLVGLEGFVEHYFPHRVSMQFGLDQDLPGSVIFQNLDHEVVGKNLYIPSHSFKPSITDRYRIWWEKMKHGAKVVGMSEGLPDSLRDLLHHLQTSVPNPMNDPVPIPSSPPGFNRNVIELDLCDEGDGMRINELFSSNSKARSCKSTSSQNAASSCAGSSNAKDISMGNNNLLKEEEEVVVEFVELTNRDELDTEVDDVPDEIGGINSADLEQRNDFSARMNSIRARLTNVERTFAEVKAAWLARN